MNGKCETYRLNEPMRWKEFLAMPTEHQKTYIKKLREKFNVPDSRIARMMCVAQSSFSKYMQTLGLNRAQKYNPYTPWDRDGWYLFTNGVELPKIETVPAADIPADEVAKEDVDFIMEQCDPHVETQYTHFETPADEFGNTTESGCPVSVQFLSPLPFEEEQPVPVFEDSTCEKSCAIPDTGSMTFTGNVSQIVNTLIALLGSSKVLLSVKWDVVE